MSDWEEFLNERPLAVIATVDARGVPHAVPVEVIADAGKVYTWGHADAARLRNVRATGAAALTAYKGAQSFVTVRGRARTMTKDDPDYERLTQRFLQKYDREETYGNDTLLEITPENVIQR